MDKRSEQQPKLRSEEVIEENGEERLPHEQFYSGVEESAVKEPFVSQPLTSVPIHTTNMGITPGPCVRCFLDISSFILCLFVVIVQLGLIDYYYLSVMGDKIYYAWLGADSLVIVIMLWMIFLAIRHNRQSMEELSSADSKVNYAWVAWFVYSVVLSAKIVVCFKLFYDQLPPGPLDNNDKLFDDHLFKLILALSVFVFLFLLEAHHYTPLGSARQLYITYLVTAICLDLLDTVAFLDLLWQAFVYKWKIAFWLEVAILALAALNFVLPTFTLLKLRLRFNARILMISERVWMFFYVLLVNGPFLGLRIYLYVFLEIQNSGNRYDASLFVVKNVAMIYIALRELWTRLHYWRQKRIALGSRGELTALGGEENDH